MNLKNINLSPKSLAVMTFSVLVMLGLLGYWFVRSLESQTASGPEDMPKPTLPPPQLTAEEIARIQKSVTAPVDRKIFSEQTTAKILQSLTAPKK